MSGRARAPHAVACRGKVGEPFVGHRPRGEPAPVRAALLDGVDQLLRMRDGSAGDRVRRASRSGRSGSGNRVTAEAQPSASAATWAWCSAAPQLMTRLRPSGSAAVSWRVRSAYSSSALSVPRHRQGWVLWTLGARVASSTIRRRVVGRDCVGALMPGSVDVRSRDGPARSAGPARAGTRPRSTSRRRMSSTWKAITATQPTRRRAHRPAGALRRSPRRP